tara:strand:- start:254 stop:442 length:189 start_codon:yes stop_codon:yes gene_type:complete
MKKCPVCDDLITPCSVAYKASSGFLDKDGVFHETDYVIMHRECYYNYLFNPFDKLEEDIKNS